MKRAEPDNKTSKMMVSLAWVDFLAMLVIGFGRYLDKKVNPNERPDDEIKVLLVVLFL